MVFLLDQPVTKNQILNTICQAKFCLEREEIAWPCFEMARQKKTLADIWCLVFSHRLIQ